jgi:hypothetical protein
LRSCRTIRAGSWHDAESGAGRSRPAHRSPVMTRPLRRLGAVE